MPLFKNNYLKLVKDKQNRLYKRKKAQCNKIDHLEGLLKKNENNKYNYNTYKYQYLREKYLLRDIIAEEEYLKSMYNKEDKKCCVIL